ncbi:hypothetical protein [Micromonospora sp. NPDC005087]|uniref:hypothetical protein n=1 Tax=Micromonospora sp. NPDC005087 TaxID=3364225 RepID=UPI00369AB89E
MEHSIGEDPAHVTVRPSFAAVDLKVSPRRDEAQECLDIIVSAWLGWAHASIIVSAQPLHLHRPADP